MSPRIMKEAPRCLTCYMSPWLCVCAYLPKDLEIRSKLLLIVHRREIRTTSNTGKLACRLIPQSEIFLRGNPGDLPLTVEKLTAFAEGMRSVVLLPSKNSVELSPALAEELTEGFAKGIALIVPDGTWSQAIKIPDREKTLSEIQAVRLPLGEPSSYRLRTNPNPEKISTFEAITRALTIFEGPGRGNRLQEEWERFFQIRIEWGLWSKGKFKRDACLKRPPLPPADQKFDIWP